MPPTAPCGRIYPPHHLVTPDSLEDRLDPCASKADTGIPVTRLRLSARIVSNRLRFIGFTRKLAWVDPAR